MNKIKIRSSPAADSRSAKQPPSVEELTKATKQHQSDVNKAISWFSDQLKAVSDKHDYTKLSDMPAFHKALTGGKVKESNWYKSHITKERHHLRSKAPTDVNLIDVIECIIDCSMAGLARSGEIYDIDLPADLLVKAVANTVELIKANTEVDGGDDLLAAPFDV
jgi:hypothetical protein